MIHVVFNEADVEVLQKAMAMDEGLQGSVQLIRDDYAVGPIHEIYTAQGMAARTAWWQEVLSGTEQESKTGTGEVNDAAVVKAIKDALDNDPSENLWIWAAQNSHDVCGYYWLISQLNQYQGRVFILYLNNLPFLNEKGQLFYPTWLHTIPPKEFIKAKKLARPVTLSEFEVDPDEWMRLCGENKGVRVLEGGKKLAQYAIDYYDKDLRKYITADWQKASRIIHHFQHKNAHTTGDAFLLWRLKQMIAAGGLDVQGELKGMKDFEVKLSVSDSTKENTES